MSQSLIRLPEVSALQEQVSSVLTAASAVLSAGILYATIALSF